MSYSHRVEDQSVLSSTRQGPGRPIISVSVSQEREQVRADSDVSWNPWGDVMFNVRPEVRDHYYGSGTCNPEIYQVDGAAEHSSEVEPDLTTPPATASDSGALNKSLSLGQVVSCGTQISTLGRVSTDDIERRACT